MERYNAMAGRYENYQKDYATRETIKREDLRDLFKQLDKDMREHPEYGEIEYIFLANGMPCVKYTLEGCKHYDFWYDSTF